jgi:plastocyanin
MIRAARLSVSMLLATMVFIAGPGPTANAAAAHYRIQLDAKPPSGEPWDFLRYFPQSITVHQGDVIRAQWGGSDAPHTATVIPSGNPNAWRADNQGADQPQNPATFPYTFQVPDQLVGGDDNQVDINPAVAAPTDPTCGTPGSPCTFDGSSVVNSGFQFSNQSAEPSFSVKVDAPAGTYAFVCLVHPGMQAILHVAGDSKSIPSPSDVTDKVDHQIKRARNVYGPTADDLAQATHRRQLSGGRTLLSMWAGGFWNKVTANEYPDQNLKVHVGDKVRVLGNFEIHTATFPKSSATSTPLVTPQCEQSGADAPASSPADCSSPDKFQLAFNNKAVLPSQSRQLTDPKKFVNSGIVANPSFHTFVADKPGTYNFVCLVHGPEMSGTIVVKS